MQYNVYYNVGYLKGLKFDGTCVPSEEDLSMWKLEAVKGETEEDVVEALLQEHGEDMLNCIAFIEPVH